MAEFDTSSPQSRLIKSLCDAYLTLDMKNVAPLLSKDYVFEPLPESAELPKQTKEGHIQTWGKVLASTERAQVRI